MAVPYTFGTATSSIPLSQLDSNFATVITLGNTAIQLGNTVTTLNNMTLANVTISSGNITLTNVSATTANVTTANITTAVIGTETVTTSTITTANVTTANITTANITTGTVITSLTLSYGTANGVAYLNGSKVLTTGSAFVFDGTNVGIGTSSPGVKLDVSGVIRSTGTSAILSFSKRSTGTGDAWGMYSQSGEYNIYDYTAGVSRLVIDSIGNVGIGTSSPSYKLDVSGVIRGTGNVISGDGSAFVFGTGVTSYLSGSSTSNVIDLYTNSTQRMRIDSSGNVLVTNPAGLGYGTGSGGTVTQATSRTTGVTLSKPTGAITMFSAAGSVVAATFTVTNTLVAATDTIILNQKSGTNLYVLLVTAVAAGSFNITFYTTGGVATDAPVINFAIIKGAIA